MYIYVYTYIHMYVYVYTYEQFESGIRMHRMVCSFFFLEPFLRNTFLLEAFYWFKRDITTHT